MATIYRALVTAVLLLWGYVVTTGLAAGGSQAALAWHLKVALVAVVLGVLIQSLPFAYFLGTHFWVKAFAKAADAGEVWSERHRQWMQGRAYPAMYLAPALTLLVAVSGGMVETGRLPYVVHPLLVLAALGAQVAGLVLVPAAMRRNSQLMDSLADQHQVPRPDTPEMDALVEREERHALPPLFQLSRVLLLFAVQCVLLWAYLRFGTEGYRGAPFLPFGLAGCLLLTLGLGLNARYDPESPTRPTIAWGRAVAVGAVCLGAALWLGGLT